jgi:hypothetical protein
MTLPSPYGAGKPAAAEELRRLAERLATSGAPRAEVYYEVIAHDRRAGLGLGVLAAGDVAKAVVGPMPRSPRCRTQMPNLPLLTEPAADRGRKRRSRRREALLRDVRQALAGELPEVVGLLVDEALDRRRCRGRAG